ncbi:MAG: metallophosphoesterase family protein [Treponemataceae bacterium]
MIFLVCADIHGNKEALKAVLRTEKNYDKLLILGDIVGYGADSSFCLKKLTKNKKSLFVSGNHDAAIAGKIPLSWFSSDAKYSIKRTQELLHARDLNLLATLPETLDLSPYTDHCALAVHGSPIDPLRGYMWGGEETSEVFFHMKQKKIKTCFASHTHQPSVFFENNNKIESFFPVYGEEFHLNDNQWCICNPGSVGFPRFFNAIERMLPDVQTITEKSFPANYFLWNSSLNIVTFKEVRYNIEQTEKKITRIML